MSATVAAVNYAELGPFPEGWELVNLGDICDQHQEGVNPSTVIEDVYVGLEHIEPANPRLTNWGRPSDVRSGKTRFRPSDILYGKLRPYLDKAVLAHQDGICSTDILVVRCQDGRAFPEFLIHALHTREFIDHAIRTTHGVNHPRTSWASLRQFALPLPSLDEQRRIARVLSAIQRAIEAQEKVIAAARELKRSLMKHLFTYGPVPISEASRVPLKETEIGPVRNNWPIANLSDVARIRYGLGQPPALADGGVPMIRATDIKRGRIIGEGVLRVSRDAIPLSREPFLRAGEVLVVRSGAYTGDVAIVTDEWNGAVAGYDLIVTPSASLDSQFCSQYLLGESAQKYFGSQRARSAQPHLNSQQLGATQLPFPALSDQREVAGILSSLDAKIATEEKRKSALQSLFKSMLHYLMTGKVRVPAVVTRAQ